MNRYELLNYAIENGIIKEDDIRARIVMDDRNKFLNMHSGKIWQGANGYWYTRLPGRKLLKKKDKADIENEIINYYRGHDDTPTMRVMFDCWIKHKLERQEICKGTYDRYLIDFDKYIGADDISKRDIREIQEIDLELFIRKSIEDYNLTAKSYGNLRTLINGIFKYAKAQGMTEISITEFFGNLSLSRKCFTKHERKTQIFMEDEIPKVINWLKEHPSVENYGVVLAFYTGMRMGELAALKFSDIEGNRIHVQRQEIKYSLEKGKLAYEIVPYTKTVAGDRWVIVPPQALKVIENIKELNPYNDYMMYSKGRLIHKETFNRRLYRACDELGIERRSMHKVRKTYGTTLLDGGADDSLVMSQMGHADISTTRKYYYFSNKTDEKKTEQIVQAIGF